MTSKKADDVFEAITIASETVPLPTVREIPRTRCAHVGCDSLAAQSDRKCYKHSKYHLVSSSIVEEVNERLKSFAPEAADLAMEAARAGAANGDHKAAAWILTHSGVVKPVGPAPAGPTGGPGLVVQVGIILPGLPGAETT